VTAILAALGCAFFVSCAVACLWLVAEHTTGPSARRDREHRRRLARNAPHLRVVAPNRRRT